MTTRCFVRTLAIVVLAATTTDVSAQSLAGLAKKAQENSAKTGKETQGAKAYSNGDLKEAPPPEAAPVKPSDPASVKETQDATKSETSSNASSKNEKSDDAKKEAYWRGRTAPIKARLAEHQARFEEADRRVGALTAEVSGIGVLNTRRGGVESERQRLITEREKLRSDLVADRKALSDVQEEGRRAGALPGWLRD